MDVDAKQLELFGDFNSRVLSLNEYQIRASTTAIYEGKGTIAGLMYVGLGLGESGEVQGKIKKVFRDKLDLTDPTVKKPIAKELGDMLWYVANTATELGYTLEQIAVENLDKLSDRAARGVLGGNGDER